MKKNTLITSERIFLGALVNAYSNPVMDAKISLNAMRTYLVAEEEKDRGGLERA